MVSPTLTAFAQKRLCAAIGAVVLTLLAAPSDSHAQGLVQGVQQGAAAGNKAAGPVGGVLGGAIGGVVGVFTGVLGVNQQPANGAKEAPKDAAKEGSKEGSKEAAKSAKATKAAKADTAKGGAAKSEAAKSETAKADAAKAGPETAAAQPAQEVLTQPQGEPQLTAEQIVSNSDANIQRIKEELNLTPEQEKNWTAFNSAMHYLGHNGADRLNLRIARAKRDPPDDIIEQMRNEAQFLDDRALDQRNVADAAEPLYTSLDDKQKQTFIEEMVRLSHERGLD